MGLNTACSAREKCLTGNIFAVVISHPGALFSGIKTSEIKSNGSIDAFTIAGEASALGIAAVIAKPSILKHMAPTPTVTRNAGIVLVGASTL